MTSNDRTDTPRLDEHSWTALRAALTRLTSTHAPGWTDANEQDPGVTLLHLMAFLTEELIRRDAISPRAGANVARLEHLLARLPWRPALEVSVDGERWEFVASLQDAAPDARVFSYTREGGLVFGDGRHGRTPLAGGRVTARFRPGGEARDDATILLDIEWPPPARVYTVTTGRGAAFRFEAAEIVGESWSGAKRPRYFEGRLLTAADLREEQEYHIRRRRELQAALHGPGVVAGLDVAWTDDGAAVTIRPGLAIDAEGRDIRLSEDLRIPVPADPDSPVYVVIEYAERAIDPAPSLDAEDPVPTRIEEGCRVRLSSGRDGGVAIARLIRTEAGWSVDASHPPDRAERPE